MSETQTVEHVDEENLVDAAAQTVTEDVPSSGEIELLPPARVPDMTAITTLREHVGAMREAKFFAEGMCYTALVPDRFRGKPGDGAAAILYGAELGLSPIASLRSVIVIHGQPGLEARTMKALLKAKGYRFVTHESTDEACDIEAWSPDSTESERCRFTIQDAEKAQWVPVELEPGKYKTNTKGNLQGNMKYLTEPRTMLRAKATAVVCREIAPHILLGMPYSADELATEDWSVPVSEPERRRPAGSGVDGMRAARERREAKRQQRADIVDAEEASDPGQDGGNDASEGAAVQGANYRSDSRDQDTGNGGKPMSEATRRKWLARMFQLLSEGDCSDRDDQLIVITGTAHAAGHPGLVLEYRDELTDDQLRDVVGQLNKWSKDNALGHEITELLNAAALKEMETEAENNAATTDSKGV